MATPDDFPLGIRIISKAADRSNSPATPRPAADDAPAMDLELHRYEVNYVPQGCTDFEVGDQFDLNVPTPPPTTIVLHPSGPCDGVMAVLVD